MGFEGFGVWGLGFGVWGLGFGVWGSARVWGLGFGVQGLGGFGLDFGFGFWNYSGLGLYKKDLKVVFGLFLCCGVSRLLGYTCRELSSPRPLPQNPKP